MATPRRTSFAAAVNHHQLPISAAVTGGAQAPATLLSSAKSFLKKPHAFPFLLSFFLFLTWISLRFQRNPTRIPQSGSDPGSGSGRWVEFSPDDDRFANLVRFSASSEIVAKDNRGWLLNPISIALDAHISGGATSCASVHVGEIKPGGIRGNHRHHTCNETFVIWGAKMIFRLENNELEKGYAEVKLEADEVAVAASPSGTAHALVNIDETQSMFFLGCQDGNSNNSQTDFNIWKDL